MIRLSLLAVLAMTASAAAAAPDVSGIWQNVHPQPALGAAAPLLPDAAREYAANRAALAAGHPAYDGTLKCKPPGLTRLLAGAMPFQIVQAPNQLVWLWQWNHLVSWARLDRGIDAKAFTTYQGNAAAHADGDAMVVDSAGFNQFTLLDDAGLPHSDALHVTQRLTLADGGRTLVDAITLDDPKVFTHPWTVTARYRRLPADTRLPLDVCEDRVNGLAGFY